MFTRIVHDSFYSASIILNTLLIGLILSKTPRYLRCYSLVLLYLAVVQLSVASSSLFVYKKVMSTPWHYVNSVCGPCRHLNWPSLCFKISTFYIAGMAHFCVLIAFCYCYRCYVIVISRVEPKKRSVIITLVCVHLPTVAIYANFGFSHLLEREELERAMNKSHQEYEKQRINEEMLIVIDRNFSTQLAGLWFQGIIILSCMIIATASIRLNKILAAVEHMSLKSRKRHQNILKSLLWQSTIPALYAIFKLTYHAAIHKICCTNFLGHVPLMISAVFTALSPLFNIIFTPPYGKVVFGRIFETETTKKRKKNGDVHGVDSASILLNPIDKPITSN